MFDDTPTYMNPSNFGASTGGSMTRDGSAPKVRGPGVSAQDYSKESWQAASREEKAAYVSTPGSRGYNPSSPLYDPMMDTSAGGMMTATSAMTADRSWWVYPAISVAVLAALGGGLYWYTKE